MLHESTGYMYDMHMNLIQTIQIKLVFPLL